MGVSAKTAIKQAVNNGRYKVMEGNGSIGNREALMGLYWDFEGGGGAH